MGKKPGKVTVVVTAATMFMLAIFIGFQPTVQQAAQTETVEDALKDASFVCNKLEEVTVTLRGANDLWAEAFKKSILRMPYIQPELYSMTYVLEVDFPDWDNELRATHLPEVKVASDGDVTLLRTQEFGRSSRQNSFLVTCTVSSKDPLPTDQVHVLINSGSHPEYTIEKDVYLQ